jgi:signal transduction histidine kinase
MTATNPESSRPLATILVVDDDPGIRVVLKAYLARDYRVLEAEDGAAALELLGSETVDLVLLDVYLPGASGLEVCRSIKQRASDGMLPVLMLTSADWQDVRNEGLEAGADDFLLKPADRRELLLRVRAFLRLREQDRLIRQQVSDLNRLASQKDYLFKLIVHDLRNPLFSAAGYLRLLEDELRGRPTMHEYVERALGATTEMQEILEGVAEVYVLEEGKRKLEREHVAMGLVVREAIQTVLPASLHARPEVEVRADPDAIVMVDRKLARRCIENLVANALTYSSAEDAVQVVVSVEPGGVVVEVLDRGPGIPDELKVAVFEKFGSVEGWMSFSRRGLGQSLYLVKLIAAAHDGTVSVTDREGGGSVFRVWFPRLEA